MILSHQLPRISWEQAKIFKTRKSKMLGSEWIQYMNKWFGKWDASHLLHDSMIHQLIPLRTRLVCNVNVLRLGKDVEAYVSHIILRGLHQTTK